ncbi:hypothetical protein [Rugamonas sp.]|uniref:hypothetical protein n=1 Tax=Rugamonas sp. TaxID=1926287 RepID=UPI0025E0A9AA|nr:hypothetical protein [Rugamonas sp.]
MKRTVPVDYEGLWRRTVIRRSNGGSDSTTRVWWLQSSRFHIDLRIPADRPAVADAAALALLPPDQLARYAAQTGFAGVTAVDGTRCAWHPEIAFPYVSSEVDAGEMRFDSPDHLHETGLDDSYEEDWLREPSGAMRGVRLQDPHGAAIAYLLISERWAAWACGRPDDEFAADAFQPQRCSEFSIFHRQDGWTIVASNFPWLEKTASCEADALDPATARQWQVGQLVTIPWSEVPWKISDIA